METMGWMQSGEGRKQRDVGQNFWATSATVESDCVEKGGGGMWRLHRHRLEDEEVGRASMGSDPG